MGPPCSLREQVARDEAGAGVIVSVFGIAMVLMFMFFSAHILLNLFARSTVTSLAYEAARIASAQDGDPGEAEALVHAHLGSVLDGVSVSSGPEFTVVTVTATGPSLLPGFVSDSALGGLRTISVSATARTEREVDP